MRSFVQFLSTPTADTPGTSLLLHFDNKRYLIGNIHEGTQRSSIQRGKKLNKVSDIFLTGKTEWRNTGGLLSIMLTLADSTSDAAAAVAREREAKAAKKREGQSSGASPGKKDGLVENVRAGQGERPQIDKQKLRVHGGSNLVHTVATARRFVFRKGMPVSINEFKDRKNKRLEPDWEDENIRVWAMSITITDDIQSPVTTVPRQLRKRSFGDYTVDLHQSPIPLPITTGDEKASAEQEDRDQQIRLGVVGHMFDSDWRLDALVETPLSQVQMPAALFIRNTTTNKIEKYARSIPSGDNPQADINVLVRRPWPGALVTHLPPAKPSAAALSYIIRSHPQRGRFLPKKALGLGVPAGPLFAQLTAGRPVQAKDGTTVYPEQVLEDNKPGNGFAVVDLPSTDYVERLLSRMEWRTEKVMEGVGAIIWILGPHVVKDERLQSFMSELSHMKHIISSADCCSNYLSFDSASASIIRLNQIDPERFPIPVHNNQPSPLPENLVGDDLTRAYCIPASRGLTLEILPTVLLCEDKVDPPLNTATVLEKTPESVLSLARATRKTIASPEVQKELMSQDLPSPDAEIVLLGTGSAIPSKYRNVSATLLRVPGSGSYLLDCGENTLGQLSRVYTQDELREVLSDLKMIWISHMHADHHLGTVSVIKAWYNAVYGDNHPSNRSPKLSAVEKLEDPLKAMTEEKRLFVASGDAMIHWLREYSSVEDYGFDKIIALNVCTAKSGKPNTTSMYWDMTPVGFRSCSPGINEAMRIATGLVDLAAANVPHCFGAKGVSLTFPTSFKFTYSGDCRPSRSLAEIGQGSTVLLHEATFDDELRGDAQAKQHSTTSEAIGMGIAMGARRVLLTHFSQRYQKIPVMDAMGTKAVTLESEDEEAVDDALVPIDTGEFPQKSMQRSISAMVENDTNVEEVLTLKEENHQASTTVEEGRSEKSRIRRIGTFRQKAKTDMKVGVAFDYMKVKVKDIALLERFTPALVKLYAEDEVEDDAATASVDEKQKEADGAVEKSVDQKKNKKIGGGRMGRVKKSESDLRDIRDGTTLFDESTSKSPRRRLNAA